MAQYASNAGRKQLSTENCESEIKTFAHKQKLREVTTSDSKERNFWIRHILPKKRYGMEEGKRSKIWQTYREG